MNMQDVTENRIKALENIILMMASDLENLKQENEKKAQTILMNNMSRCLCVSTYDPWKNNQVRFYHPVLHKPDTPIDNLPFAKPISSMGGIDGCGLTWIPPAGSTLAIVFENGIRSNPYYLGTTWNRDIGPNGANLSIPVPEYQKIYGDRRGNNYLVGKKDGSQFLPPWNTENYNGKDIDSFDDFSSDPEEQKRNTYANIYGFKTPEMHMVKLTDGNAKCQRKGKRIEIQSSCGNWFIMKDDHLHYGGQWAHPDCPPSGKSKEDISICSTHDGDRPYYTDIHGNPIEELLLCGKTCDKPGGDVSCSKILGGHPSTPSVIPTKYSNSQGGANKYFKYKNECRPYKGPGTPQNNKCDLPQSGIQILSIGGHTMVFDDSVEEPVGAPLWERSLKDFDFGCNNKCLGVMYIKSMTGHSFIMSDIESDSTVRGKDNLIRLKTATGNSIELNDETIGGSGGDCTPCPPNYAGPNRGIKIQSTSKHQINLIDHMNEQCSPCRKEGGEPIANATQAYMQLKSGSGLEMMFSDDNSQQETQNQWIQITHPQCIGGTDEKCNSERGPHYLRFQGRPKGEPGIVMLRAGGHSIRQTYDKDIVLVGDKERNPSDKFTYVSKMHIRHTEDVDYRYSGQLHIFFAEKYILLMAGRDCPPKIGKKCKGPCLYPVVVGRCAVVCPFTGIVHWTEKSLSERVFASAYHPCDAGCQTVDCPPGGLPQPCTENAEEETE